MPRDHLKEKADTENSLTEVYKAILQFLDGPLVQTTKEMVQSESDVILAMDLIPFCFPELEIFCWALCTPTESTTLENLKKRFAFSQLYLDDELRAIAKEGFATTLRLSEASSADKLRADQVYEVLEGDKAGLFNLKTLSREKPSQPYSVKDIEDWLVEMRAMAAQLKGGNTGAEEAHK